MAAGLKEPYVGAYTQIDFSLPCPSIFDSKQEIWEKYGIRAPRDIEEPMPTITGKHGFGVAKPYKELYGCQGFPEDYIIDKDFEGNPYPRSEQVKRCGNAVCPPIPAALVRANLPELCKAVRMPICRPDRMTTEENGQLRFV